MPSETEVQGLRVDIRDLTDAAVALERGRKRNRRAIVVLRIVCAVLTLAVIWLGKLQMDVKHNASVNAQNRRAAVAACQSTNDSRAESLKLWNKFLSIIVPKHPTPAVASAAAELRAAIAATYAPKDCTAILAGVVPSPSPIRSR